MKNINNYFKSKEVELLKTYSLKANKLCSLTDEFLSNKYPIITFEYTQKYDDGTEELMNAISLFEDFDNQVSIDPIEFYGKAFLNSGFKDLGKGEKAIFGEDGNELYSGIEIDLIKRISIMDNIIDDLENGRKEYIRTLSYIDGSSETFENKWV